MQNKIILFIIVVLTLFISNGQNLKVTDDESYKTFVEQLNFSKDHKYQEVLAIYDDYIATHPNFVKVKVYKCKFIGSAYYDEYEDYDTNWEETDACIAQLYEEHPKDPYVLIYKIDYLFGEEKTTFLNDAIDIYYDDISVWSDKNKGRLFEQAAYHYSDIDQRKTLMYADKAERFDKDLDLSLLVARTYNDMGNKEKAREVLDIGIFYDHEVWILNQKGELLVELGEYDKALKLFDRVKVKDSTYLNNVSIYKILLNSGKYEHARSYLVDDTISEWNKTQTLQKLLNHDIEYSSTEVALKSYERMQVESYYDDFFGIKRLQIFFKDPFNNNSTIGFSHFIILLLLLAVLFMIPYLWVMPVYSVGKIFKLRFDVDHYWNLKHFWLVSFAYLFIQTLLILVFYYQDYMNYFFEITSSYYIDDVEDIMTPNELIVFTGLMLISTLIFLNKKRLKFIFGSKWFITRIIGMSIAFFIFNIVIIKILGRFVDLTDATNYFSLLNLKQEIIAMLNEKGFLITMIIVAIFVPFYEEIIFRGIILNSTTKYIGFKSANTLQAVLFGIAHFNLALFPFYFIFGLVTGYAVKRTNGLIAGIAFHAVNNLIIVIILYYYARNLTNL